MKKLILGLLAAALVTLGLVGTTSLAHADPYTGTVPVTPAVAKSKVKPNKKAKIPLATAGNVVPTGTAKVVCKNGKTKVKANKPLNAKGLAKTGKLKKKGKWTCTVTYTATPNSVFQSGKFKVKVKVK
ncbi:hypothetical protein [Nocardioides humi]|uniref:Bacterial Ig-like domain-containing protein n=1 Tax=Nocardioides humi TaxID=449461 RepID=A0ABN2AKX6_9ACTN|nr:hypothetical protein [Nocardioides humi]